MASEITNDVKTIEIQLPHIRTGLKYRGGGSSSSGSGGKSRETKDRVCTQTNSWGAILENYDGGCPEPIEQMHILRNEEGSIIFELMRRQIQSKISSYKSQDIDKELYDEDNLITFEAIRDTILACDGKCYYCGINVKILYNEVRDRTQWTVDRIYNNRGHYKDNFVIACLGCNLHRRCRRADEYKNTCNMIVEKIAPKEG